MTRVASVYAQALYDLAKDEQLAGGILEEMQLLKAAFQQNPDYLRLLSTPNLSKEERCGILEEGFGGKIAPYLLNFIKILTEKGYARCFPACCDAYQQMYNADNGILPVKAYTAVELTQDQRDRLRLKLEKITGKTIELQNVVDPGCIGGVRLDYDGKRVDDTVQHRLDAVRSLLKNTML